MRAPLRVCVALALLALASTVQAASKADEAQLSALKTVRELDAKLAEKKEAVEVALSKPGPCDEGYYQATPKSPCTLCEEGYYCPGGTPKAQAKRIACDPGFSTATGVTGATSPDQCFIICNPGEYALITQGADAQCLLCDFGFFCPGGPQTGELETRISCAIGFTTVINDATQQTDCVIECDAGFYAQVTTGPCEPCGLGSYCEGGPQQTPGKVTCPPDDTPFTNGTTSESLADCVGCGPGTSLLNGTCVVICAPGYYANSSTAVACEACPANSYCEGGLQTTPGVTSCPTPLTSPPASSNVSACVQDCQPGFYSPDSVSTCIPCGPANYCPGGSQLDPNILPCPPGTFTVTNTSADAGACQKCAQGVPPTCAATICSPGYYEAVVNAGCVPCGTGNYCTGGTQPPGGVIAVCPDGLTTISTTSGSVTQCVRDCPPGTFAPTPTAACQPCGVPYYCPGGYQDYPKRNPCPQTPPPPYTTLVTNATSQAECVVVCPSGQYSPTAPLGPCVNCGVGSACAGGPQVTPIITPCVGPATTCSATASVCINTATDPANCGVCGNACPIGATCLNGGCVCADTQLPVASATTTRCGTTQEGKEAVTTYEITVAPGGTYSLVYDSLSVPDRYTIRYDSPCGPEAYDTGFTGKASSGCTASAPCCVGPAPCAGTANKFCPPNENGGGPPGGSGAGTTPNFVIPPTTTKVYVTAFGVCGGTVNYATLKGANGGTCPRL